jgi:peroxiredoxin
MNRSSLWSAAALVIAMVPAAAVAHEGHAPATTESKPASSDSKPAQAATEEKPAPTALAIGSPIAASDVKMKGVDGKSRTIAGVAGKSGTLVIFTCNACPWAKAWETRIAELGNAATAQGLGVIAINANDPKVNETDGYSEMQKRSKKLGLKFPYVVDATSDVARAYGATRTPEIFLFDASGNLVYHGAVDDNAQKPDEVSQRYLRDAIDAVSSGKPVPVAETKALGCSIKFRKAA